MVLFNQCYVVYYDGENLNRSLSNLFAIAYGVLIANWNNLNPKMFIEILHNSTVC